MDKTKKSKKSKKESVEEAEKDDVESKTKKTTKSKKKAKEESEDKVEINEDTLKEDMKGDAKSNKEQFEDTSIINAENIKKYWKNQEPNQPGQRFIDQIFPPITESLLDKKVKTEGAEKINLHEIDWKKAKEIIGDNLILFPGQTGKKKDEEENIDLESTPLRTKKKNAQIKELVINFTENKGTLFDEYSQFFQAINILVKIPGLIPQLFKTKEINPDGYYEVYINTNGEYKILILDDFFPIVKGTTSFRFSKPDSNEIWLLLLEKAYAKVNGGYASLLSSTVGSVLKTFLGFPCEKINFFDIDLEDLENTIRANKGNSWMFSIPNDKGLDKGLVKQKGYQLLDIFDVRTKTEQNEEKNLKLLKIRNDFEAVKYKGDFSNESTSWNEDIKRVVNFRDEEKDIIFYMTLDDFHMYFTSLEIFSIMFDNNVKLLKISNNEKEIDKLIMPQCFNLYVSKPSRVSMSIIIKNKNLDVETTEYDTDLTTYKYLVPTTLCYSKFDIESKKFSNFEGCFSSNNITEITRDLEEGFYVIWTYISYEFCNDPKPEEYFLKIQSQNLFKVRFQCTDYKFHLIREMVHSGILQFQGPHIKEDEIYTMNDNFYNLSGLGLKVIINPFEDCYQKWEFQPELDNMIMLYPYNKVPQFEAIVYPKNYFIMLAMKVDNSASCAFEVKSHFKTLKYSEGLEEKDKYTFTFNEFCSEDVRKEKYGDNYYEYANKESLNQIANEREFGREIGLPGEKHRKAKEEAPKTEEEEGKAEEEAPKAEEEEKPTKKSKKGKSKKKKKGDAEEADPEDAESEEESKNAKEEENPKSSNVEEEPNETSKKEEPKDTSQSKVSKSKKSTK